MVLKVWASSPISVRLQRLTRWEKSPRARARLDCVRTCNGLVMRRAAKMLTTMLMKHRENGQQTAVRCIS